MHFVQIFILFAAPLTSTFIVCRFGSHLLRVLLWAWLTLLPVTGPLPHISHFLAIFIFPIHF